MFQCHRDSHHSKPRPMKISEKINLPASKQENMKDFKYLKQKETGTGLVCLGDGGLETQYGIHGNPNKQQQEVAILEIEERGSRAGGGSRACEMQWGYGRERKGILYQQSPEGTRQTLGMSFQKHKKPREICSLWPRNQLDQVEGESACTFFLLLVFLLLYALAKSSKTMNVM